jgi:hypothetical protein
MTTAEQYKAPLIPLSTDLGRRFLYARYNADLSATGLRDLGFPNGPNDNVPCSPAHK